VEIVLTTVAVLVLVAPRKRKHVGIVVTQKAMSDTLAGVKKILFVLIKKERHMGYLAELVVLGKCLGRNWYVGNVERYGKNEERRTMINI